MLQLEQNRFSQKLLCSEPKCYVSHAQGTNFDARNQLFIFSPSDQINAT
jgi:hypothetical protein